MKLADFITGWMIRTASWPGLIVMTIANLFIRFGLMTRVANDAPNGAQIVPLDLRFAYPPGEVEALFAQLGKDGLAQYAQFLMTLDIAYPITYLFMLTWALALLLKRKPSRLLLLPLGIFVFDMLENGTIVAMASIYPESSTFMAIAASVFTTVKWCFSAATIITLIWLIISRIAAGFRTKKSAN